MGQFPGLGDALAELAVILLCGAAPVGIMQMLVPRLELTAPRVSNYRGRKVFLGLGIVWTLWMVFLLTAECILRLAFDEVPTWLSLITRAAPLVIGACTLGMLDDLLGSSDTSKGFHGHFSALRRGQITTGMVKFIGIGALSFCSAVEISGQLSATLSSVGEVLVKAAVIALCANELNLFDLRPARALKVYLGVLVLSASVLVFVVGTLSGALSVAMIALVSVVPVVAIWPYDAGERGMMGDSGSNAMGAFLGYFLCCTMSLRALFVVAAVLLAMNLASERVSYSRLIERSPLLSWIDALGRPRDEGGQAATENVDADASGCAVPAAGAEDENPRENGGDRAREDSHDG